MLHSKHTLVVVEIRNLVTKASQKNLGYHKILSALDALTITDKKPLISADADEQVPSDEEVYPRVRTVVDKNTAIAKAPLFLDDEAMLRGPPTVQRVQGMQMARRTASGARNKKLLQGL